MSSFELTKLGGCEIVILIQISFQNDFVALTDDSGLTRISSWNTACIQEGKRTAQRQFSRFRATHDLTDGDRELTEQRVINIACFICLILGDCQGSRENTGPNIDMKSIKYR